MAPLTKGAQMLGVVVILFAATFPPHLFMNNTGQVVGSSIRLELIPTLDKNAPCPHFSSIIFNSSHCLSQTWGYRKPSIVIDYNLFQNNRNRFYYQFNRNRHLLSR